MKMHEGAEVQERIMLEAKEEWKIHLKQTKQHSDDEKAS